MIDTYYGKTLGPDRPHVNFKLLNMLYIALNSKGKWFLTENSEKNWKIRKPNIGLFLFVIFVCTIEFTISAEINCKF